MNYWRNSQSLMTFDNQYYVFFVEIKEVHLMFVPRLPWSLRIFLFVCLICINCSHRIQMLTGYLWLTCLVINYRLDPKPGFAYVLIVRGLIQKQFHRCDKIMKNLCKVTKLDIYLPVIQFRSESLNALWEIFLKITGNIFCRARSKDSWGTLAKSFLEPRHSGRIS